MRALQPADPKMEATELCNRVTEQAQLDQRPADEPEWPARRRAVRDLCSLLSDDPGIAPLAATVANEEEDRWCGAGFLTDQLGFKGQLAHVVFWLIGLKSTSDEADSKYFHALQAASCDHAGVAASQLGELASAIYDEHGDLLRRWIAVQYALTAELLVGIDQVVLHRGDTIHGELRRGPTHPNLRPLPSFATHYATAASFAERAQRYRGGTALVYSAIVPVERIVATPVTGAANALEREIVLTTGNADDLATITWI
jgi:hypothetical protein